MYLCELQMKRLFLLLADLNFVDIETPPIYLGQSYSITVMAFMALICFVNNY